MCPDGQDKDESEETSTGERHRKMIHDEGKDDRTATRTKYQDAGEQRWQASFRSQPREEPCRGGPGLWTGKICALARRPSASSYEQ